MAPPADRSATARAVWGVAGTALALLLLWWLSDVVMLAFAGALLALVLTRAARRLAPRLPYRAALAVVVVGLAVLLAVGAWLAGGNVGAELQQLRETLPKAWTALRTWLDGHAPGRWLLHAVGSDQELPQGWMGRIATGITQALNGTLTAIGTLVLVLALGIYFAADPLAYRRGALRLLPPAHRGRAAVALDAVTFNLGRWLKAQGLSMLAVGLLTAIGLTVLGMPLVVTLSLLTAVLDFVPYFGSIAASLVIVAVAFGESERQALYAAAMCLVVQQAEAYIVQPVAQRWAVRLPPALSLLAVLVFGLLFGLAGALLAVPLMVVLVTLVQQWRGDGSDDDAAVAAAQAAPLRRATRQRNDDR